MKGRLLNTPVIIANIYGPNWGNEKVFRDPFAKLPNMTHSPLILGGDFNCWLHPTLDRSCLRPHKLSSSAKAIKMLMTKFALIDPWRHLSLLIINY